MNHFQTTLWANLTDAVAQSEAFFKQTYTQEESSYVIFNYRLASYTDFLKPSALECRGIMFEVDSVSGTPIRLASLPFGKFFNLNECPFTMNLDLTKVDTIEEKMDGSLISSYTHKGDVYVKSKGSISSEQAVDARRFILANSELLNGIIQCEASGFTVNMEWCSPNNRIVIGYLSPQVTVLNVRNRDTGDYMDRSVVESIFGKYCVRVLQPSDPAAFIASIPKLIDDIEGYIGRIGQTWFKVKTDKYLSLHRTKDSITNPRRLFDAVIDEASDDLRAMFSTDPLSISMIDQMETKVRATYNHIVASVEAFHQTHKHLDRKAYALTASSEVDKLIFSLVMNLYLGKTNDYKSWMKSKYKAFGINDTEHVTDPN